MHIAASNTFSDVVMYIVQTVQSTPRKSRLIKCLVLCILFSARGWSPDGASAGGVLRGAVQWVCGGQPQVTED